MSADKLIAKHFFESGTSPFSGSVAGLNLFDRALLGGRVGFALAFILAFGFFAASFAASILSRPILGLSISDCLTAMLALGTLALAYAALIQVIMAAEKRREDLSPRLDIQLLRVVQSPSSGQVTTEALVASPFFLRAPKSPSGDLLRLVLRNLGPGSAVGVAVTSHVWGWRPGVTEIGVRGPDSLTAPSYWQDSYSVSLSLKSNEDHEFPLEITYPDMDASLPGGGYRVREQFVVVAEGTDVAGRLVRAPLVGFRLMQVVGEGAEHVQTVWRILSESEARAAVLLGDVR